MLKISLEFLQVSLENQILISEQTGSSVGNTASCSHAPKAPSACQAMDGAGRNPQFREVDGSLRATIAGGDGNAVSCMTLVLSLGVSLQVASARPQGTIGRAQFIGSGIEALLFGIFSDLVMQSKNMKGNNAFSKHYNYMFSGSSILPLR